MLVGEDDPALIDRETSTKELWESGLTWNWSG